MKILGIHDGHNAAAALVVDGRVVAAAQEERFNRQKNWSGFPAKATEWVLNEGGVKPNELDMVAVHSLHMPYPKDREALLREYRTTGSVSTSIKRLIRITPLKTVYSNFRRAERLRQVVNALEISPERVQFVEHHAAHAAAAYYGWGRFNEPVLVLTNDGAGDGLCASVWIGSSGKLERLVEVPESESIGNIYAVVTFMLGMVPLEHEYKVMGMAPYAPERGRDVVLNELRPLMKFIGNGTIWKRQNGCPPTYYAHEFLKEKLELKRFDWICAGLQAWTEEMLTQWVRNCVQAFGVHNVALGGGVFMNVKANKAIGELPEVKDLFVFPSCGDESNAIGAAYWVEANSGQDGRHIQPIGDLYLGPSYTNAEIGELLKGRQRSRQWEFEWVDNIEQVVAELLAEGNVVARFAGRMEFGARALGNRSILADPSRLDVIRTINDMIKKRDFWMPFAPAILEERAEDYLVNPKGFSAPYMILSFDTTERVTDLRAAVHPYDFTARPQIVIQEWNPSFYQVIKEFEKLTGRGVILNTSFNLHGYPIVCSPTDALYVFENSGLKYLAIENWLLTKGNL